LIDDVLALYVRNKVADHARPDQTAKRMKFLKAFWGGRKLSEVTGATCREYARQRSTQANARRELEDLRAAIIHHRREGLHDRIVSVVMPAKSLPRERWLTREEAARLLIEAWRYSDARNGRRTRKHIAKFALVALYTGSRAGVVCSAAFKREEGRAWVDVERGVLHRRAEGERETKKRRPAVRLPDQLVAHLRRWKARGQHYVVEWNGEPVERIDRIFRRTAKGAGLGADVTPHTLRHTAATWLMQNGADLWDAAGYLGMTVQTLERVYGHHHPDHQSSARDAFRPRSQPPMNRQR
jgi:integrase